MTIRAVSQQEFDTLVAAPDILTALMRKTVEWFAADTADMLGVIAHHEFDFWSFMVLARNHHGRFLAVDLDVGFMDPDEARRSLFASMETALAAGVMVLPSPFRHTA